MSFDPKKAVDAWKKAKPLMLTKTGISELLRVLPAKPTQAQLTEFTKAVTKLEAALADPKIKKEKKAHDEVQKIHDDIKRYLADVVHRRTLAIEALGKMHAAAALYHGGVTKAQTLQAVQAWATTFGPATRGWLSNEDHDAVPAAQATKVQETADAMKGRVDALVNIMTMIDPQTQKLKSNPKIELPKELASLKLAYDKLPEIANELKALKP
jgi:hypothetical protein